MKKITEYDKLIRDRIPQIIHSQGKTCETTVLGDQEYLKYLYKKLQEELNEFLIDDNLEELADITEVIHAIVRLKDSSVDKLEEIRGQKYKERGGFEKKLLLRRVVG